MATERERAERPLVIPCAGDEMLGVLHPAAEASPVGMVIAVGGPQYRVGSHRQFVGLARTLAEAGVPVLRFDCRGMGDSGGAWPGFENVDDDLRAAVDAVTGAGIGVDQVVLWGLCDAASAILLYAHRDPRVRGVVLLNPWVRTEATYARTQLRHYYLRRLVDRDLWQRLLRGRLAVGPALADALRALRRATGRGGRSTAAGGTEVIPRDLALPDRMARGLEAYRGPALVILSGNDLTAREFEGAASSSPLWRRLMAEPRLARRDLVESDHTFSRRSWKAAVADWTREWIAGLSGRPR